MYTNSILNSESFSLKKYYTLGSNRVHLATYVKDNKTLSAYDVVYV